MSNAYVIEWQNLHLYSLTQIVVEAALVSRKTSEMMFTPWQPLNHVPVMNTQEGYRPQTLPEPESSNSLVL